MQRFLFWHKWLLSVSALLTVFGAALALFNQTPVFELLFNRQVDPVFWGAGEMTPAAAAFQQWAYAVLGATVAGWGISMIFIVYYPFRRRERWAWRCLAVGLGAWYVIDTSLSLAAQVTFNAAFNTLLLALIVPPLIATHSDFKP
jgi:hypothetical protein